jgi:ABC-type transport system involved in cytochrome c biogenesis permease subunit
MVAASGEANVAGFLWVWIGNLVQIAWSERWWNRMFVQEKMNNPQVACFLWIGRAALPHQ